MSARLAVLISGGGTNLQAVLDACAAGRLAAQVVGVVSDKPEAFGLERARRAGVPAHTLPYAPYRKALGEAARGGGGRAAYDRDLAAVVAALEPDLVVLAGFMRILTPGFIDRFAGRLINLHPALPGAFPGVRAIERAFAAWQRGELSASGVMVHHVIPEVDAGPTIAAREVPFAEGDTLERFAARLHATEHRLIVEAIAQVLRDRNAEENP